ncbi:MAG TPA: mechanosensitive ion channel [Candidatus Woesearchaeota archaeon]|nr:mechanosensitive ion channel [Candidatus Woesearchaeota archaeon]
MIDFAELSEKAVEWVVEYSPTFLVAIITLVLGLWVISIIKKIFVRLMTKNRLEPSLKHFLASFLSVSLKILLVITIIGMLGVETTSFVAVIAAMGFAVGLALQGSLSNFAGGVLILITKPFKVGDFIEAQGFSGTVNKVEILATTLKTPDNKTIIIPNGSLSNSIITNFSTEKTRRVDMTFGISYSDDMNKAHKILESLVKNDSRVLKEPKSLIVVSKLNDSSVDFSVRAWVNSGDYWPFFFDMQKRVKGEFDKNKISIPFPQQDVHVYRH